MAWRGVAWRGVARLRASSSRRRATCPRSGPAVSADRRMSRLVATPYSCLPRTPHPAPRTATACPRPAPFKLKVNNALFLWRKRPVVGRRMEEDRECGRKVWGKGRGREGGRVRVTQWKGILLSETRQAVSCCPGLTWPAWRSALALQAVEKCVKSVRPLPTRYFPPLPLPQGRGPGRPRRLPASLPCR